MECKYDNDYDNQLDRHAGAVVISEVTSSTPFSILVYICTSRRRCQPALKEIAHIYLCRELKFVNMKKLSDN